MDKELFVKTVFDWDHFATYLSGPIDYDRNGGAGWREEWSKQLVCIGFKAHQIFNPCKKPLKGALFNLDNEAALMKKHRDKREWSDLMNIMSQIVHFDLRLVDKSDLILVNIPKLTQECFKEQMDDFSKSYDNVIKFLSTVDKKNGVISHMTKMLEVFMSLADQASNMRIPTYGTMHEIVVAHQQRKPIFLVWEGGKETCSAWLMWLVGKDNVFGSFDELKTRLVNISKGKAACNAKEWLWLDFEKTVESGS